jgi:translation initiation factor IF-3
MDKKDRPARVNHQIRVPKVMLIKDGNKLGIFNTDVARNMAFEAGLDLVEVSPQASPPVCLIMDYGKFKYEQQKKKKSQKQAIVKEKEIVFRYVIEDHDLDTKINHAKELLDKGDKVKLVVKFKRRENAHKEQGFTVLSRCLEKLADYSIEKMPAFEGDRITARLAPKKVTS